GERRLFAERHHAPPHPAADMVRMGVHGADTRGIPRRVEERRIAQPGAVVTAVECRAARPAAASCDFALALDDEIGAVVDQLGVETHDGMARGDLGFAQIPFLEFADRERHYGAKTVEIGRSGEAMRQHDAPLYPLA